MLGTGELQKVKDGIAMTDKVKKVEEKIARQWVRGLGNEESFELLRVTSQRLNRKLRDLADEVVRTGTLPGA